MSNYVPLTPIGGPAGQPLPPQQSFQPPPPKKSNVKVWVLAGCGALILIWVIGGYFVRKGAKEAGVDLELMQKSPGLAIAKMMVAANPDVFEIVSVDDEKRLITIRNKQTGKSDTLNMDARDASWIVAIPGDGEPYIARDKFATADPAAMLPAWFPSYPGATVPGTLYKTGNDGAGGRFNFSTTDSIEKVVQFYEDNLKLAGLTITTNTVRQNGAGSIRSLAAEVEGKRQTAFINAISEKGQTQVTVVFASK